MARDSTYLNFARNTEQAFQFCRSVIEMPLQDMFWGADYGSLVDQFGVQWMLNYTSKT